MDLETKYIIALTNLYGMVNRNKVIEIYNMQNEGQIKTLSKFDKNELKEKCVHVLEDYFISEVILEFEDKYAHADTERVASFYVPPKDELLKYVDGNYFEMNEQYQALARHLEFEYGVTGEALTNILFDVNTYIISNNNLKDFCKDAELVDLDKLPFQNAREIAQLIIDCANNTRTWANKGYTPSELLNNGQIKNSSIDNLWICGSGKSYKECYLEDELDTSVSFLNQFEIFLTLLNDVIDVCQETDIDLIKNVCDLFFDYLDLCFEEFKDEIDDCEVLFTKLFNRIIDNNSNYHYPSSKLYKNSDWNNESLENKELKKLYSHNFVNDYVGKSMQLQNQNLA